QRGRKHCLSVSALIFLCAFAPWQSSMTERNDGRGIRGVTGKNIHGTTLVALSLMRMTKLDDREEAENVRRREVMYEPQYSETQYSAGDEGNAKFLIGLLTGCAIGAAVGLMFAPKAGSELRQQLSTTTERLKQKASEPNEQASGTVTDMM